MHLFRGSKTFHLPGRTGRLLATVLLISAVPQGALLAQTPTSSWTGAADSDWRNTGNWNNGVPISGGTGNVLVMDAGTNPAIIDNAAVSLGKYLYIGGRKDLVSGDG